MVHPWKAFRLAAPALQLSLLEVQCLSTDQRKDVQQPTRKCSTGVLRVRSKSVLARLQHQHARHLQLQDQATPVLASPFGVCLGSKQLHRVATAATRATTALQLAAALDAASCSSHLHPHPQQGSTHSAQWLSAHHSPHQLRRHSGHQPACSCMRQGSQQQAQAAAAC